MIVSRNTKKIMESFIVVSKQLKERQIYINTVCQKENIDLLDITTLISDSGIGIKDIRIFQKSLQLKPFKSLKKIAVVEHAHTITIPAQNALLKTLEEPPANTLIFLSTETTNALLPTILSRCSLIVLTTLEKEKPPKQSDEFLELLPAPIGKKLQTAQIATKTKETTISFLEDAIESLRKKLYTNSDEEEQKNILLCLKNLHYTYKIVTTTNTNARLAMESLLLSL